MSASFRRGADPLENPDLRSWQQRNGTGIGRTQLGLTSRSKPWYASVHGFVRQRTFARRARPAAGNASGKEAVVDLPGHGVALARRALEAWPVDDGDPPPRELDETGPLQDPRGHG